MRAIYMITRMAGSNYNICVSRWPINSFRQPLNTREFRLPPIITPDNSFFDAIVSAAMSRPMGV